MVLTIKNNYFENIYRKTNQPFIFHVFYDRIDVKNYERIKKYCQYKFNTSILITYLSSKRSPSEQRTWEFENGD